MTPAGDAVPSGRVPTISIIVPCFNGARHLRETLESAVHQTLGPHEVIVVDDGSTDDSVDVAHSFGSAVRVVCQANQGVSVARNTGLGVATGDYVLFLDADDRLALDTLRVLCRELVRTPDRAVVFGFASFEESPERPIETWRATSVEGFFPHLLQNCIAFPGAWLFPRRTVLEAGSFDASVRIYQFWHFLCKVALTGVRLRSADFTGVYYRQSPTSMIHSASPLQVARGHVHVQTLLCREILKSRPDLLEAHGEVMFWAAWTAMHRARRHDVPSHETAELVAAIGEIARRGPMAVRRTRFARMIRIAGVPLAERVRTALTMWSV
jgi:hypothetical protein